MPSPDSASDQQPSVSVAASSGHAAVDEVRADVGCPACGYNLRGLSGSVVLCPECGATCDIAALVTRQWTRPWWRAPRFNTILLPACWAFISWLGTSAVFGSGILPGAPAPIFVIVAILAVVVAVWGWLMVRAWWVFEEWQALVLAMLAHLIVVGYVIGIMGVVGGLFGFIAGVVESDIQPILLGAFFALIGGLIIWTCGKGERFIASYCIQQYLKGSTRAD